MEVDELLKNCLRRTGKCTRAPSGKGGCGNASASETTVPKEESSDQPASQTTLVVRILAARTRPDSNPPPDHRVASPDDR